MWQRGKGPGKEEREPDQPEGLGSLSFIVFIISPKPTAFNDINAIFLDYFAFLENILKRKAFKFGDILKSVDCQRASALKFGGIPKLGANVKRVEQVVDVVYFRHARG